MAASATSLTVFGAMDEAAASSGCQPLAAPPMTRRAPSKRERQ